MAKQYRFIKSVIYDLKRRYGQEIDLKQKSSTDSTDYTTGVITASAETTQNIKRAILLPAKMNRPLSIFDTNFSHGGFYDKSQRTMIIDNDDLGSFAVDLDTYVTFGGKDWEIKETDEFEESRATMIIIVALEGAR